MTDYPYIRAYGAIMGSNASFIEDQVAKARRMKAASDTYAFGGSPAAGEEYPLTLEMLRGKSTVAGITAERIEAMAKRRAGK